MAATSFPARARLDRQTSSMIYDAENLPDGLSINADLCIVGAGAAGISMALQFIGTSIKVLLLESGGVGEEPDTQALYAGSVADEHMHGPPGRYRQRRFGGTTTIWGGRCMPFDDIDFDVRDYVPHSGWPYARDVLIPYYVRANWLCEAGEFAYTAEDAFHGRARPIIDGFDSPYFSSDTLERFSCPTDFSGRYGHRLAAAHNITVLLHANVTRVQLRPAGDRVATLAVRTLKGKGFTMCAEQFVLAAGGLEVARLLLASQDVQQNGIGNDADVVGRYYMCHVAGTIGAIRIDRPLAAVHHGYEISDEGIYCRRRFALRAEVQRQRRLGNFIARLHHPRITDPAHRNAVLSLLFLAKPFIPYEYAVRLHGQERYSWRARMQHVRNVAFGAFDAAAFAWHMLRDRKLADRKFPSIIVKPKANLFSLDFHAEQQPNPDSRVTLAAESDALGMRRLHVDWRYTRGDIDTVAGALALLASEFARSGVGSIAYDASSVEAEVTRYGAYGGHHIGTARMGSDRRSSVVNANCRVHGVDNLFIAGSATFPTSSQANPTLTVVALALRLAEHVQVLLRPMTPTVRTGNAPAAPPSASGIARSLTA
jgi:choline dehydrogenase-like flavoprotein